MNHIWRSQFNICENEEDHFLKVFCLSTSEPKIDSGSLTSDGQCEGCLSRIHQFDGTNQPSIQVRAEPLFARDENP